MSFFEELKRRNVFKVGIAYLFGSWLLVQLADMLLNNIGAPAWVLQVIFIVLGVGFFITLFFAWAYEMTPDGVKREQAVDSAQSITPQTGKKLTNAILVLMALSIAYLLFDKFSGPGAESNPQIAQTGSDPFSQNASEQATKPEEKRALTPIEATPTRQSIAVLPFDNRSKREEDEFFTAGIHDDLLTTIAKIGSMKVISRTSVMEYKNTTKKIPEIARELGVANILEGGIQRSGNQVRINVQLIDAATDTHLWAEIYDRELTAENLFAIQSEISTAIAAALEATLSPEEEQRINTMPTNNLAAYNAYLRGRQLMASRESARLEQAIEEFQTAVASDPRFALAWVGVADAHQLLSSYGTLSREDAIPIREDAIKHALTIDDRLGEAYASLASIHGYYRRYTAREAAYKKAIELSPNYATAYHWYALSLRVFPLRSQQRVALAHKALELDPRSSIIGINLAGAYLDQGLYSRAQRQAQKVLQLDPEFSFGYSFESMLHSYQGRFDKAIAYIRKAREADPGSLGILSREAVYLLQLSDVEAAEAIRPRMEELDPGNWRIAYLDMLIGLQRNKPAGVRETINGLLPRLKHRPDKQQGFGLIELALGNKTRAREIYLATSPGWLDPARWQDLINVYTYHGCVVAWLLRNTGDEEKGTQLLRQTTVFLEQDLPAVIEHADRYTPDICFLTAGDKDKALDSIETQLAHNHIYRWDINHRLPMYDLIRTEPRYQAFVAARERRIVVQREAIAKMDAKGAP